MNVIIRLGAYMLSGYLIWYAVSGGGTVFAGQASGAPIASNPEQGLILGVCAGISNFTGIDVNLVRTLWVSTALVRGIGMVLYILAFILMPPQ